MRVKFYVGMVAGLAVGLAAAASVTIPSWRQPSPLLLAFFVALVALADTLQVRYHHHDSVDALVLLEGVFAPLIFAANGATIAVVVGMGVLVGEIIRHNDPLKRLYNVAQWVAAASAGGLVWHSLSPGHGGSAGVVFALMLSLLTVVLVNQALFSGVLWCVSGHPLGSPEPGLGWSVLYGRVASFIGALVFGLLMTAAYLWQPWSVLVVTAPLVFLWDAGRAQASLRADSRRLQGLQRATHALATSVDMQTALPLFLAEVKQGFEVRTVQLVMSGERQSMIHTFSEQDGYVMAVGRHELADLLCDSLTEPTHLSVGSGVLTASAALERTGHQRLLAAPLQSSGETVGMLLLFDRVGMEGFEAGELGVAAALTRELVGFLERVELVHEITEERRKLTDILENTSDGILSIDADGTLTSWNAGLVAMTGYRAEEMIGTRHFGLLRPRDTAGRDVIIERWLDLIDGPAGLPMEIQVVTSDGRTVWLSCSYSRIPAAEERRDVLVVVARNITQARELERLKDDFVAVVSHELRTPLVPIKGWAQTLINRGDRLTDDQRRTAVQSILAQAQKLESLVLNILEASRIEAGRADGDGVADVAAIAMRVVEDTLAARPDRMVRVRPPSVPCQVRGSAVWVERAVSNLVANAVKYSPDDEAVDVAVTTEGDEVVVSVTDRGPGIAADAQERIFERFERLEESRKQTGTGLGLYITRRLARAMGGDVTLSSVPGAGSTFVLRLPAAPVPMRLPEQRVDSRDTAEEPDRDGTVVNLR